LSVEQKLYLLPSNLSSNFGPKTFAATYIETVYKLKHFVVENERSSRRFLSQLNHPTPIHEMEFRLLNEHSTPEDLQQLEAFLKEDHDTGLLSEAGCPGIADPGADLVRRAHQLQIEVRPLVGPSSILLALMASGLNGQTFTFHGYLPREERKRREQIKRLERESQSTGKTQLFIEAPYRNKQMFQTLVRTLAPQTQLSLACELTSDDEWIHTRTVGEWKTKSPSIHKKNVVFSFLAPS